MPESYLYPHNTFFKIENRQCVFSYQMSTNPIKTDPITPSSITQFRKTIYSFFKQHARILPWRTDFNPYDIFISEVMLQQTQVDRVIPKFLHFKSLFPDFQSLANSRLETVLDAWQGLGYNRRAVALREASRVVVERFNATLPSTPALLQTLPGIGPATAASIAAFAFNSPTVFLETNIRTVLIHHFFLKSADSINDSQLIPIAQKTLDKKNPRKWYSALMDYGSYLKKAVGNLSKKSASYKKQTPFHGSNRQIRGAILRKLLQVPATASQIAAYLKIEECRVKPLLNDLVKQQILTRSEDVFKIAD